MLDSSRNIALPCALSALAGYVDAIGFLHLGGLLGRGDGEPPLTARAACPIGQR
jgi:hypothetical protein